MTLIYDRCVVDVRVRNYNNQTLQETLSLLTVVSGRTSQYWRLYVTLEPSLHSDVEPAMAVFAELADAEYDPQEVPFPQPPLKEQVTPSRVVGAKGSKTLTKVGGEITKGRLVSFAGHSKVYIVTASTAHGIEVYPRSEKPYLDQSILLLTSKLFMKI